MQFCTSMAAGYISGAAALAAANDKINLKETLENSADKLSCLEKKVNNGSKVNFYDAVTGNTDKETVIIEAEEDFDVLGVQATPEESWELFGTMANVQVSTDGSHTVVLKKNGTVWAWGKNDYGQLGNGTTEDSVMPQRILGLTDIIQISAGIGRTFALRSDGTVYACGRNTNGELGDGTLVNKTLPVKINGLHGVTQIDAYGVSMAIRGDTTVWTWGDNKRGQLGNNTNVSSSVPVIVPSLLGITQIAAGVQHCLAAGKDGRLWSWGKNNYGQLGNGTTNDSWKPIQVGHYLVRESNNPGIEKTIVARDHSLVVLDGGSIWAWGYDRNGQLGNGQYKDEYVPTMIDRLPNAVAVAASVEHSMALIDNGDIYTWGYNACGELGNGTKVTTPFHQYIMNGFDKGGSIAAGNGRSYAINPYNRNLIFNWGLGLDGKLILRPEAMSGIINTMNTDFESAVLIHAPNFVHHGFVEEANQYLYYSFKPQYTMTYTFESISNLDMYGQLYDANKKILIGNDNGGGNGESENQQDFYIQRELEEGKTYYLGVKALSLSGLGDYTIKVKYWDDYGNDIEHAYQILAEGSLAGKLNYMNDVDFFKFIPKETASYIFYTTSSSDMSGMLFDKDNTLIERSCVISDDDKNIIIKASLVAGQPYYVKIGKNSSSWSPNDKYTLNIKKNIFNGTLSLGNGIHVKVDMKNESKAYKYSIKLIDSEKKILYRKDYNTYNEKSELIGQLPVDLEKGKYRMLILTDNKVCKVADLEIIGKEKQKFINYENGAEILIPYITSNVFHGEELYFSLGYTGYELIDICDSTEALETKKGLIESKRINVLDVEDDSLLFQSTAQSVSGVINTVKLESKVTTPSFVCYAYKVY